VTEVVSNVFERHAQSVVALLLVALLLWVAATTQDTSVAVAEMRVELGYLKLAVDEPAQEHKECARAVGDLQDRVTGLEDREHTN
jgi:hypothetical protein